MEQITIRKAGLPDLDLLLQFEQGVVTAERPYDPTIRPGHVNYYDIPAMIAADHIELLVAVAPDGGLVGSGYARIDPARHYLRFSQQAYLGFMYVLPAWRGKGVNQLIIAALRDWALTRGMTEMRLDVYTDNAAAIRAYEKAGFSRYLIEMRMDIGE